MDVAKAAAAPRGARIGRYHLISPLGHGGMADVHLARVSGIAGFDKLVVIKQIRQTLVDDPEVLSMFLDEARIAARLAHANVVQTYEVGQDGEQYFLAMEFLDGQPLSRVRARLAPVGGLPLGMHLRIIADVLAGLHHAHELADFDGTPLNVVHRDVTPQNVFVTYEGAVKVVDFGIAKAACSMVETRAGFFKGKVTYIAPEQALGEHADRRADIFTTGVMLWEAVTGKRPWAGLDEPTILKRVVEGGFPSARAANPAVPEEIEAILDKALAPAREDRYATAAEFQADLEAYLDRIGERSHPRDLGRLVRRSFAKERAHIRAIVEQEVRAERAEENERLHPSAQASSVRLPLIDYPEDDDTPSAIPLPAPSQPTASGPQPSSITAVAGPSTAPPRVRRWPLVAALAAGVAIATIAAASIRLVPARVSEIRVIPAASASAAVATVPAPAPAPAPPAHIRLEVSVTPSTASVFFDGALVGAHPVLKVRRDGDEHEIRVEAPGHATSVERVVLDRDHTLRIALVPLPRAAPPPAPAPTPPPAMPAPKKQPKRPVDENNPYLRN